MSDCVFCMVPAVRQNSLNCFAISAVLPDNFGGFALRFDTKRVAYRGKPYAILLQKHK